MDIIVFVLSSSLPLYTCNLSHMILSHPQLICVFCCRNFEQEQEHAREVHCSRDRSRAAWKVIEEVWKHSFGNHYKLMKLKYEVVNFESRPSKWFLYMFCSIWHHLWNKKTISFQESASFTLKMICSGIRKSIKFM